MRTVWIVSTAEPDHEVVGVFATRAALDYEYPSARADGRDLVIELVGAEPFYAREYPLQEHEFAR